MIDQVRGRFCHAPGPAGGAKPALFTGPRQVEIADGLGAQQSHHERAHREPEAGANLFGHGCPAHPKRSPELPDVPTISELGLPGFEATSWYCIVAPAGVPKSIVTRLHTELVKILNSPEIRDRLIAKAPTSKPPRRRN